MARSSSFTESFEPPHPGSPFRPGEPFLYLNDSTVDLDISPHVSLPSTPRSPGSFASRNTDQPTTEFSSSEDAAISPIPDRAADTRSIRSTKSRIYDDIKHEVMVNHLYQQQCSHLWIDHDSPANAEGVLLRKSKGQYLACPPQLINSAFASACSQLNLQVAMTVNSRVIKSFVGSSPNSLELPLKDGLKIQILPNMHHLTQARKYHFAAFSAEEELLIVWDDNASKLVKRAKAIEDALTNLVWGDPDEEEEEEADAEKKEDLDPESGDPVPVHRPTNLMNTVLVAFTLIIVIMLLGLAARSLAVEIAVDQGYIRLAFLALVPVQVFFTLFFAQVIVGCVAQCIGPIQQMQLNSRYFSAKAPPRLRRKVLPHITVQCPVYKEGLASVIAPTVRSIKQAISTYELQGGSANMFINDDGLQIIGPEERQGRIDFYSDHSIGWTARPKHGSEGFIRKGKFKKASNMNFGLMLSCLVEEQLASKSREPSWNQSDEDTAYTSTLGTVLANRPRAWADGNIRVGDYILLIDSDTRVPSDCLLSAASEMEQSPSVGIMQFSSGVMQVVHTYFENGITFFTNLIYTAIRYTVANGDVAPFVGHNAILRWSAIQQVSYVDEDGYEKFWSESHVSEDFDMSLRLQCAGYIIRLAAWAGDGFKEGVSLTVYDELARWEKYAYGCNELLFHPMRMWIYKGPFTELFRRFLFSNIRFTSKITIVSYIGTYYAIGAAWIMTLANYFAVGWFNGYLDKYYIDSWKVWFSIVIVFNGLGNLALAVMRYRVGEKGFFAALAENFKWILMLSVFLGGLSLHVSQALLAHMFEVDMTWGSTSKEAERSNFFIEVPKVLRKFKFSISFAVVGIVGMIWFATNPGDLLPYDWVISDFIAILPMATVCASHLLLPVVLNPALMTFTF